MMSFNLFLFFFLVFIFSRVDLSGVAADCRSEVVGVK